jgi:hypothetical protein
MSGKFFTFLLLLVLEGWSEQVLGWGPEGHAAVAHIANHYLYPATRLKVNQILSYHNFSSMEVLN